MRNCLAREWVAYSGLKVGSAAETAAAARAGHLSTLPLAAERIPLSKAYYCTTYTALLTSMTTCWIAHSRHIGSLARSGLFLSVGQSFYLSFKKGCEIMPYYVTVVEFVSKLSYPMTDNNRSFSIDIAKKELLLLLVLSCGTYLCCKALTYSYFLLFSLFGTYLLDNSTFLLLE